MIFEQMFCFQDGVDFVNSQKPCGAFLRNLFSTQNIKKKNSFCKRAQNLPWNEYVTNDFKV